MIGPRTTHIYVIAEDGGQFIKIGIAEDIHRRHRQLQGSNARKLLLAHSHGPTTREIAKQWEYRTHALLAEHRRSGEWFACSADAAIDAIVAAVRYVKNRRGELGYQQGTKRAVHLGRDLVDEDPE